MPDWTSSMLQTFEYYTVDPITWEDNKKLDIVKSSTIDRDSSSETLGSASMDVTGSFSESYVRIYLVTIQNGKTERHCLGTFLFQSPSSEYDGKVLNRTLDGYTPLIELKEKMPPIGYSVLKNDNIMQKAYNLCSENVRIPVVEPQCSEILNFDFVANQEDTWISFLTDLIANAKYKFGLDELSRILFVPEQDTASLQPIWNYNDDNSSILYPDISTDHDIYGIPNVVEVIYSKGSGSNGSSQNTAYFYSKVVNDDPNSPVSTVNRGREIVKRITNPNFIGTPSQTEINAYAKKALKELSSLEYTISYTHGYCPVRVGDCVRINYSRLNIGAIKARVISQSIDCTPGCKVTEKAVYSTSLWEG